MRMSNRTCDYSIGKKLSLEAKKICTGKSPWKLPQDQSQVPPPPTSQSDDTYHQEQNLIWSPTYMHVQQPVIMNFDELLSKF